MHRKFNTNPTHDTRSLLQDNTCLIQKLEYFFIVYGANRTFPTLNDVRLGRLTDCKCSGYLYIYGQIANKQKNNN